MMNDYLKDKIRSSLIVYLQPIYESATCTGEIQERKVIAYELLSRLRNGNMMYNPIQFLQNIPLREQYHLALSVLDRIPELLKVLDPEIKLHVNFNPDDFDNQEVFDKVLAHKDRLVVEITEESGDIENKAERLVELKKHDVCIALDDFGDRHATYNYIVDKRDAYGIFSIVKIDGKLVKDIDTNLHKREFLGDVIDTLKKKGNQHIVVEYIENKFINDLVITMGADSLQGFYLSKPFDSALLFKKLKEKAS
jgi:EAL domain-containing protein (putative c-di-GMP-specific phosphodiesterase class I)